MEMKMPKTKTAKGRALKIPANSPAPTGTSHAHTHTHLQVSQTHGGLSSGHMRENAGLSHQMVTMGVLNSAGVIPQCLSKIPKCR